MSKLQTEFDSDYISAVRLGHILNIARPTVSKYIKKSKLPSAHVIVNHHVQLWKIEVLKTQVEQYPILKDLVNEL